MASTQGQVREISAHGGGRRGRVSRRRAGSCAARILGCVVNLRCRRLLDMVMVGPVLLKVVYVLTCRIFGLIVGLSRGDQAAATEVLVLRHENAVLRGHAGRVRYEPADRALRGGAGVAPCQRDPEGGVGLLCGGTRPSVLVLVRFISEHKSRFGAGPICRVLSGHGCKIAPSTYYGALARGRSVRAMREELLKGLLRCAISVHARA
jgi:hypothetical protein